MKTLKLMLRTVFSIDAIYELRKTPIIFTIIFGMFLSTLLMTPFAFSMLKDETYRFDEKFWMLTDDEKEEIMVSLPDGKIQDGKLTVTESSKIKVRDDIAIGFNTNTANYVNGVIFESDQVTFVEQGRMYTMLYHYFEGLDFSELKKMDVEEGYDLLFSTVAKGLKPLMVLPNVVQNYQTGMLTVFIYAFIVALLSMLLKYGHTSFISYKEVLNIVIYSATLPVIIALLIGFITPAFTILIFNYGTPLFAYSVYRKKVVPNLR
ncbi:MAG: DUF1189 family protein [Turicibacter sp.]